MTTAAYTTSPCYIFDSEGRIYGVSLREYRGWWERHKDEVIIASTSVGEAMVSTFWAHVDLRGMRHMSILTVSPGFRIGILSIPDTPFVGTATDAPAVWCTVVHDDDARRAFLAHATYAAKEDAMTGHEEAACSPPAVRRNGPEQLTHDSIHDFLGSLGVPVGMCRLCAAAPCTRREGHDWVALEELAAFVCVACNCESRANI